MQRIVKITTPLDDNVVKKLRVADKIEIYGKILTGRDVVLPVLKAMIEQRQENDLIAKLKGSVVMHAGFSVAGFGPTTSNKEAIEESIPALASVGVKIHLGKGSLSEKTVEALDRFNSIFAVTPPVTALLMEKVKTNNVIAFEKEGMEAMHEIEVDGLPAIVAVAHGASIFGTRKVG